MTIKQRLRNADPLAGASPGVLAAPDFASLDRAAAELPSGRRQLPVRQMLASFAATGMAVGIAVLVIGLVSGRGHGAAPATHRLTRHWSPVVGSQERGHPTISRQALPAAELSALAVLRRPQTPSDRAGDVRALLRYLGPETIHGARVDDLRVLRRSPDHLAVLLPVDRSGSAQAPSSVTPDALCVLIASRTFQGSASVPAAVRGQRFPGGVSESCGDLGDLRTTGIGGAFGKLVPDGVAKVVVRLRGHHYLPVPVRDNYYELHTREIPPGWGAQWFDQHGGRIKHNR